MDILKQLDLKKWYKKTFSYLENKKIQEKYPFNEILGFNGSSSLWLATVSAWFNTKEYAPICEKFITKSIELDNETDAENRYFMYGYYIEFFYKNRDIADNYNKAVYYCEKQIEIYPSSIAPAESTGYTQLAIIYKKEKQWQKVIDLCNDAIKKNVGGDWQKRIDEATKKLNG